MRIRAVLTALFVAGAAAVAHGSTINVPGDYPTIQAAIDAAGSGDVVLVAPGTYQEHIDFHGKGIAVRSSGGPSVTIISGSAVPGELPLVSFQTGEGRSSIIEGFQIAYCGSRGISCVDASPSILGNDIHHNWGNYASGGGIYCHTSSALIENNVIRDNSLSCTFPYCVPGSGGGVLAWNSSILLRGNEIARNFGQEGGGVDCEAGGSPIITSNWIHDNLTGGPNFGGFGGGIACSNVTAVISSNSIEGNRSSIGGGIAILNANGNATIEGNVIAKNQCYASGVYDKTDSAGGVAVYYGASAVLISNLIVDNTIQCGTQPVSGGGVACSNTLLANNTIARNGVVGCGSGGGVIAGGNVAIRNTIVWGNTSASEPQIGDVAGDLVVSYSDVESGWPGQNNVDLDPMFLDVSGGDYHLAPDSPCIDIGDPATDCHALDADGHPRVLDGDLDLVPRVDLGAFELTRINFSVSGTPAPGQSLSFSTQGDVGLNVFLVVGTAPGTACIFPYGALLMDPASLALVFAWGKIPASGGILRDVVIPGDAPIGVTVYLQQLGLAPSGAGDFTSLVTLTIE
jgi:hypothetical protein